MGKRAIRLSPFNVPRKPLFQEYSEPPKKEAHQPTEADMLQDEIRLLELEAEELQR